MSLIVEDGTGIALADSYISVADARGILAKIGQDLSTQPDKAEQELRVALRYIDSVYRATFQGVKTTATNVLQWPRSWVYIDNVLQDSDSIPTDLKESQVFAAYEVSQGNDLMPTRTDENIKRKKFDAVMETEYFNQGAGASQNVYPRIMASLIPLLKPSNPLSATVVRG